MLMALLSDVSTNDKFCLLDLMDSEESRDVVSWVLRGSESLQEVLDGGDPSLGGV